MNTKTETAFVADSADTPVSRISYTRVVIAIVIGLLISSSWLVFPYFIQGQQLLRDVGDNSRDIKGGNVSRYYTRELIYHRDLEVTATFATADFFQYVNKANTVSSLRPDKNFIFYVSESIHAGELAEEIPTVELRVNGNVYQPNYADGPSTPQHHRVSVYSFSKRDANGEVIDLDTAEAIQLYVSSPWLGSDKPLTFAGMWKGPFDLPEELKSSSGITLVAVLALGAGLLSSVLTPCLLQLVVIFGSIIGGFATVPSQEKADTTEIKPVIRRKIMQIAVAFVVGFVVLYMSAGALIGAIGHQAQLVFAEYSRMIAVISGLLVIALGIWVGLRGTSHFACKIPNTQALHNMSVRDNIGSIFVSMGYALGCTACFGGAIIGTLIVYVGAIGSASIGAGIMFIFSVGVAIPFLLAAYYISKMDSILLFLAEKANLLSKLSMVLIIIFGLILVTDNFHTLSDYIYPFLGLN